jgi:tetratricopeptide (TPR) repeat protein
LPTATPLSGKTPAPALTPNIRGTAIENEAYDLYKDNKLLTARTKAHAALDADPDSIIGHFVLGQALHEAEGVLPRAMFHLGRARELFETRWGSQPSALAPWRFHQELIFATQELAGQMEEYEFQLQLLDFHDALYEPDAIAEHAWALLHLQRFDEARKFAREAIASKDEWQRSLGKNAMCAIESEARTRQPQLDACLTALEGARARAAVDKDAGSTDPTKGTAVAVHAYNAALAAYSVLRYDEVERLAREGTKRTEFTPANPWRLLTRFYTDAGRVSEGVAAVREMHQWRLRQPASLRDQDRAETELALATLLLVAGEADTAMRLVTRALERPDRRGLTSSKSDQAIGASALLRRAVMRLQAELLAERASVSGTTGRVRHTLEAAGKRFSGGPDDERIANILADETRLESTLRVHLSGGIEPVPTWLLGELVDVIGAGVVSVVIAGAREAEKATPELTPIYDAIEAEALLARREDERALALARRALETLPKAETLLAARVAAVASVAARHLGEGNAELALLERAMSLDPGVVRRLGLSLPTEIRVAPGGDPAVIERAAVLAGRSPRLREARGGGFELLIDGQGPHARACVRGPGGRALGCAVVTAQPDEAPEDRGARLIQDLHTNTFAMRVGLTQADLKSLDGSNTLAGQAQREAMQGLLKEVADETE